MPMHKRRTWGTTECSTRGDLAEKLEHGNWTLCTGFLLLNEPAGRVLFLSDRITEDSVDEWAVIHYETMQQVESITIWKPGAGEAERIIGGVLDELNAHGAGVMNQAYGDPTINTTLKRRVQPAEDHGTCEACA